MRSRISKCSPTIQPWLSPPVLRVDTRLRQLLILIDARAQYDDRIQQIAQSMDDEKIFASFPGAAKVTAPRLMAAFGEDRQVYDSAASAQMAFAVAPVVERSGKKSWTHWRWHCNKPAPNPRGVQRPSIPHSFWAKAYYQQQKDKGSSHQAALRALAFKWTRILYRCWKERKTYDESQYLEALRKLQPPLLNYVADAAEN